MGGKIMEYLLNYMQDYEIDYLKEQYTEEIIDLLEIEKDHVVQKIESLLENGEENIYEKMSEDIDYFLN